MSVPIGKVEIEVTLVCQIDFSLLGAGIGGIL